MTAEEKLANARKKLADKRATLQKCADKIKNTKALIQTLNHEIVLLEKEVSIAELECLGEMLSKNGIDYSEIFSAVECGLFDKNDKSDKQPNETADSSENGEDSLQTMQENPQNVEDNSTNSESEVKSDEISDS